MCGMRTTAVVRVKVRLSWKVDSLPNGNTNTFEFKLDWIFKFKLI